MYDQCPLEELTVSDHDIDITGVRYGGFVDLEQRCGDRRGIVPKFLRPGPRGHERMSVFELIERGDHGITRRRANGYLQDECAFVNALEPIESLGQLNFGSPKYPAFRDASRKITDRRVEDQSPRKLTLIEGYVYSLRVRMIAE